MKHFSLSEKGPVRRDNQDRAATAYLRSGRCAVAVVCDGMGGARAGQIASSLACETFLDDLRSHLEAGRSNAALLPHWMRQAGERANREVYERAESDDDCAGMGTTLVAAVLRGHRAQLLNVGDSRAYLIGYRHLKQITHDHSYVADLVACGSLSPEQAAVHPNRNLITRAVGVEARVEADLYSVRLHPGEALLLCSDGIVNALGEERMRKLCRAHRDPEALCRALIDAAAALNARDNITAAVLKP